MRKLLVYIAASLAAVAATLMLWPAFLMPRPVYAVVYGWRFPRLYLVGDGRMTDLGPAAAIDRYTVAFEPESLQVPGRLQATLHDLPRERLTLGFIVRGTSPPPTWQTKPVRATVTATLRDERGAVIIDERGPLTDWTWSGAGSAPSQSFVFRAGVTAQTRPDGGWGTYFVARHAATYTLEVVATGDPLPAGVHLAVSMRGGGWK